MFYNHDILSDRKHGVATIWLVATLGSKSSLRKVTRKAIMDVDVPNACDTITDPSAPLALRLQGSLLFGVSRVFSQQCGYVLTDLQSLQDKMRGITKLLKDLEVDPDVSATRPEQLNLQIDPGFNIELDLGFDLSGFDLHDFSTDEPSSLLSPRTSASSRTSFHDDEIGLGEAIPYEVASSSRGEGAGGLDFDGDDFFDNQQQIVQPQDLLFNRTDAIAADNTMQIQDDGELVWNADAIPSNNVQDDSVNILPAYPVVDDVNLDLDVGDDLVNEQIDALQQQDDDQSMLDNIGDQPIVPDQPLQNSSSTTQQPEDDNILDSVEEEGEGPDQPGPDTVVVAQAAAHRNRPARTIPIDNPAELQNTTLGDWDNRYLEHMEHAQNEHANKISVAQAKRNAAFWVLDQGIGGVSADFREDNDEHPLAVFSGSALLEMFDVQDVQTAGRKRSSSAVAEEDEDRRVRARSQGDQIAEDQDDFQSGDDDGEPNNIEEEDLESEIGRHQEVPLSNGPEQMPWNDFMYISSQHGSRQGSARPPMSIAGVSSSAGGPANISFMPSSIGLKRMSRLIQESPLNRRGVLRQPSLAGSVRTGLEADITFGEDDLGLGLNLDETIQLDEELAGDVQDAEYETYGPAAMVSTQQAADSQWLAATLEQEAYNFLTFLSNTVEGKKVDEDDDVTVAFEELLPPERNSHVVAAQGLLHVLSLATKGLIEVLQDQPFGSIAMGIAERAAGSEVEVV